MTEKDKAFVALTQLVEQAKNGDLAHIADEYYTCTECPLRSDCDRSSCSCSGIWAKAMEGELND